MRLRQAVAVPAVAAIALGGTVALGGCGSDSNAATAKSTTDSMHHAAMKHEGDSMKHHGDTMDHQGKAAMHHQSAMRHEGSSDDNMEG